MITTLYPRRLSGSLELTPSDAEVCRLLAAAAFADRPCGIRCAVPGADAEQMIRLLRALGAQVVSSGDVLTVTPIGDRFPDQPQLDFGASVRCLKLLLPSVCRLRSGVRFSGSLRGLHPAHDLTALLEEHGCAFDSDTFPFYADGFPDDGMYTFSSQPDGDSLFGLALMLSQCPDRGQIAWDGSFDEGHRSVIRVLNLFGAGAEETLKGYFFPAGRLTPSAEILSPRGDPALACLWLASGAAGGPVTVCGADPNDPQIAALLAVISSCGSEVKTEGSRITAQRGTDFRPAGEYFAVPASLLPAFGVLLAGETGETVLYAREVRDPSFAAVASALHQAFAPLGKTFTCSDGVCSVGGTPSRGKVTSSFPEVLAAALLAACTGTAPVSFTDLRPLQTRWRPFSDDLRRLGAALRIGR